jgi:hypothetical protein
MKVGAPEIDLPFLCWLGRHQPKPVARWNCGYYFTTCARCHQDLVRTAYGGWHVPYGYRVVWQAQPPANAVSAALVQDRAAAGPDGGTQLPIEEVLRHIQNGAPAAEERAADPAAAGEDREANRPPDAPRANGTEDESEPADAATPAEQDRLIATAPARRIPDFMDEPTGASAWESSSRAYLRRPARAGHVQAGGCEEEDRGPGPFRRLSTRFMSLLGPERSARAEPLPDRDAPGGVARGWRVALVLALAVIAVLLLLLWRDAWEDGQAVEANESVAHGAQISPGAGQPAYVTASLLNCRSAPAREAESLKVLVRGDLVRLLARDGEWVSLEYEGGQCWALIRYFSLDQPI